MSRKSLLMQVTVYDEETGNVEQTTVQTYGGYLGYEVRKFFYQLGERFAKLIDPRTED